MNIRYTYIWFSCPWDSVGHFRPSKTEKNHMKFQNAEMLFVVSVQLENGGFVALFYKYICI